jgi:hypothetical protein
MVKKTNPTWHAMLPGQKVPATYSLDETDTIKRIWLKGRDSCRQCTPFGHRMLQHKRKLRCSVTHEYRFDGSSPGFGYLGNICKAQAQLVIRAAVAGARLRFYWI